MRQKNLAESQSQISQSQQSSQESPTKVNKRELFAKYNLLNSNNNSTSDVFICDKVEEPNMKESITDVETTRLPSQDSQVVYQKRSPNKHKNSRL